MKYLLLILLLLSGCNKSREQMRQEAIEKCKCHDGVFYINYYTNSYFVTCKNGTSLWDYTEIFDSCEPAQGTEQ